jgi:hypothetical protein
MMTGTGDITANSDVLLMRHPSLQRSERRGFCHGWRAVTISKQVWELFVAGYGPTKSLADSLGPERRESLKRDVVAYH